MEGFRYSPCHGRPEKQKKCGIHVVTPHFEGGNCGHIKWNEFAVNRIIT